MPRGNPARKFSISVESDVARQIEQAAAEDSVSVSAWITGAAEHALLIRRGLAAIAEYERENGAFTEEELEAARRRMDIRRAHGEVARKSA